MVLYILERIYSLAAVPMLLFGVILRAIDIDLEYLRWLQWTYQPIIIALLLPFFMILFVYISAFAVYVIRFRSYILGTLADGRSHPREACLNVVALIWDIHGRIFHGYSVEGLEKLPREGPVFIVYYHGTTPIDMYYLFARIKHLQGRAAVPVVDRFVLRVPGLGGILEYLGALAGSVDSCARNLQKGNILMISPGGVREALFADEYYSILWGRRVGFAKVAIKADVPIYPVFSENCRDVIRVVQYGKSWFQSLYERTRLPIAIFYGYFPVKLRTHIGDPIYPSHASGPDELADMTRDSMESLISKHQLVPGNLIRGLAQRIPRLECLLKADLPPSSASSHDRHHPPEHRPSHSGQAVQSEEQQQHSRARFSSTTTYSDLKTNSVEAEEDSEEDNED